LNLRPRQRGLTGKPAPVKRAPSRHGVVQTSLFNVAGRTEDARTRFDLSRCEICKLAGLKTSRLRDQKPKNSRRRASS
jgi:hypothetical protein